MGYSFEKSLTVNGMSNLLALLIAQGYDGPALIGREATIYNTSGAVPVYLHFYGSSINPPGVQQVETLSVLGTVTGAGNASLVVTAAGMTGSPITISVPVTVGMEAVDIRTAAISSANADARIAAFFDLTHDYKANLIGTAKSPAANDGTMNFAIADDTSTGVTTVASSANTTAGSLATTSGLPILVSAPSDVFTLPKGADLSNIWLYTASSISVKVGVLN